MTRGPSQEAGSNCAPSAQDLGLAAPEEDPHDVEGISDDMLAHKRERLHDVVRSTSMPEREAVWAAPCNQASQVPQAAHVLRRGLDVRCIGVSCRCGGLESGYRDMLEMCAFCRRVLPAAF